MCIVCWFWFLYVRGHMEQLWGFSPVWINMCVFRVPAWMNAWGQCLHPWGFVPLCINMCALRCLVQVKDWGHCLPTCGFAPLCISMCFFRDPAWGFAPLCINMCVFRFPKIIYFSCNHNTCKHSMTWYFLGKKCHHIFYHGYDSKHQDHLASDSQ